jgi:hypothetical protein
MWKLKQKLEQIFDSEDLENEVEKIEKDSIKDKIQGILLSVLYIGGIMLFLFLLVDKLSSCESEPKNEWTTVNIHDCFSIDIPPMLEIVEGTVSRSGIVRGIWDEELSCFQLRFWAESMSETITTSSPYAVVYISYDINPFECIFGEEVVSEEDVSDVPEDVVYKKFIEPDLNAVPDFPFALIGTPKFGNRVINGRNLFVVEYVLQMDDEEYPPIQKQVCCCSSTNGSRFVITVACDSEELMDDMMKIIETLEILQ